MSTHDTQFSKKKQKEKQFKIVSLSPFFCWQLLARYTICSHFFSYIYSKVWDHLDREGNKKAANIQRRALECPSGSLENYS